MGCPLKQAENACFGCLLGLLRSWLCKPINWASQKPKATKQVMLCGSGLTNSLEIPFAWPLGGRSKKELREMYFTVFSLGSKLPLGLCWASLPLPLVSTSIKKRTGVASHEARICSRSARLHSTFKVNKLRRVCGYVVLARFLFECRLPLAALKVTLPPVYQWVKATKFVNFLLMRGGA
jgi:hypothetical protein